MQSDYSLQNPFCVIGVKPGAHCNRTWLPTTDAARLHAESLLRKSCNPGMEFYVVTPLMLVREASRSECVVMQNVHITSATAPKKTRRRG